MTSNGAIPTLPPAASTLAVASSAEEGLREIGKQPPDLLVVDYYLPGIRGDELCRRIRMDNSAITSP